MQQLDPRAYGEVQHVALELPTTASTSAAGASVKLTNGGTSVEFHSSSHEGSATTWWSSQGSAHQGSAHQAFAHQGSAQGLMAGLSSQHGHTSSPKHRRTQSQSEQGHYITLQQLQQFWLEKQGMQRSLDDLAAYVDHIASASAKSALALQQSTWEEKQQLELLVQQQSAKLQQLTAELDVLRGLAQQHVHLPPVAGGNGANGSSSSAWQDARLQQQVEWHKQEVTCWYKKYSAEAAARHMAESALHNTLVIVEQLEDECAGISGMLKDVVDVEAAAAAAAEADKKRWKPLLNFKASPLWIFIQLAVAVCVIGCAGIASAYIALGIRC